MTDSPIAPTHRHAAGHPARPLDGATSSALASGSPSATAAATAARHRLTAVTDDSFGAEVLEDPLPVLVEFGADWCPPCRAMRPVLERLDAEREDVRIVELNTDDHPATAARYGIMSAPTLILFRGGAPVHTLVGSRPYARLTRELDAALGAR